MGYQYGIFMEVGIQYIQWGFNKQDIPDIPDIRESNMAGKSPWPKNFEVFVWKNQRLIVYP